MSSTTLGSSTFGGPGRQRGDGAVEAALPLPSGLALQATDLRGTALDRKALYRRDGIYRRLLAVADVLSVIPAVLFPFALAGGHRAGLIVLLAIPVVGAASKLAGLYDRDDLLLRKSTLDEAGGVFQVATLSALLVSLLADVIGPERPGAGVIVSVWMLLLTGMLLGRWGARHVGHVLLPPERCLVVGDPAQAEAVSQRLAVGRSINAEVVGLLALSPAGGAVTTQALEAAIVHHHAERVILAPRTSDHDLVLDTVRLVGSLGIKVSILPRLFEAVGSSVVFDHVHGVTMLGVRRVGLSRSSRAIKRTVDVVAAALGLIAAAPFIALVALAIRRDSPGPVLYRQKRVGRGGRQFEILKFRTMQDGAHQAWDEMRRETGSEGLFKLRDDPRVTKVGRWLRRTSLDELPQLFNVLRGDMSLVGPRPLIAEEDALVTGLERRRLDLTPGMTGPWQVLGTCEHRVPLEEMVKIDYLYSTNWSLFGDAKILLRTALHVLGGGGV